MALLFFSIPLGLVGDVGGECLGGVCVETSPVMIEDRDIVGIRFTSKEEFCFFKYEQKLREE